MWTLILPTPSLSRDPYLTRGSPFRKRWVEVIWFCAVPSSVRILVGLVVGWLNVDFVLPR